MPTLRPGDLEVLERTARSLGDCRLIVIDPVSAYLGDCDDHRDATLRPGPLAAEGHGRATGRGRRAGHPPQQAAGSGINGKYRVLGSIAYVGACRANFLFLRTPTTPGPSCADARQRRQPRAKQPALAYVIRTPTRAVLRLAAGTIDLDADGALARAANAGRGVRGGEAGRRSP